MPTSAHPFLRTLGNGFHHFLTRSRICSKLYLVIAGWLLRRLPSIPLKKNLIHNILSPPWPDLSFSPKNVAVCRDMRINLIPHTGEFDCRALLSTTLDYEEETFEVLYGRMAEYDAVIEIGANVGVFSVFFGKRLEESGKEGVVFSFEPSIEAFTRLRRNLEINQITNVKAFNCAVGNETGIMHFYEPKGHLTNGSLSNDFAAIFSDDVTERAVISLSGRHILKSVETYDRLLLKIDVEGAERLVLEGLDDLIREKWPDIILEVLEEYEESLNTLSILNRHYRFFAIGAEGLVQKPHLESSQYRDYLLIPNARVEHTGNKA